MRFITICDKDLDLGIIEINIDHIITISEHYVQISKNEWTEHAKILLSNGTEIICDESREDIEKDYKELFKQYC